MDIKINQIGFKYEVSLILPNGVKVSLGLLDKLELVKLLKDFINISIKILTEIGI